MTSSLEVPGAAAPLGQAADTSLVAGQDREAAPAPYELSSPPRSLHGIRLTCWGGAPGGQDHRSSTAGDVHARRSRADLRLVVMLAGHPVRLLLTRAL